jgi:hypothetical protein
MLEGIIKWMAELYPWLFDVVENLVAVWILIVLPLLLFRKSRPIAIQFLLYSSYFTGLVCWWYSVVICYSVLGTFWLIFGLVLSGIGVVPITLIGIFFKSFWNQQLWEVFGNLVFLMALVIAQRGLAAFIVYRAARRLEREAEQQQAGLAAP